MHSPSACALHHLKRYCIILVYTLKHLMPDKCAINITYALFCCFSCALPIKLPEITCPHGIHRLVMVVTHKYYYPAIKPPSLFCPMLACTKGGVDIIVGFYGTCSAHVSTCIQCTFSIACYLDMHYTWLRHSYCRPVLANLSWKMYIRANNMQVTCIGFHTGSVCETIKNFKNSSNQIFCMNLDLKIHGEYRHLHQFFFFTKSTYPEIYQHLSFNLSRNFRTSSS